MKSSDLVRVLIESTHLTQEEIADRAGISHRAIQNWLYQDVEPSLKNFNKLCKAVGFTMQIEKTHAADLPQPKTFTQTRGGYSRLL